MTILQKGWSDDEEARMKATVDEILHYHNYPITFTRIRGILFMVDEVIAADTTMDQLPVSWQLYMDRWFDTEERIYDHLKNVWDTDTSLGVLQQRPASAHLPATRHTISTVRSDRSLVRCVKKLLI